MEGLRGVWLKNVQRGGVGGGRIKEIELIRKMFKRVIGKRNRCKGRV